MYSKSLRQPNGQFLIEKTSKYNKVDEWFSKINTTFHSCDCFMLWMKLISFFFSRSPHQKSYQSSLCLCPNWKCEATHRLDPTWLCSCGCLLERVRFYRIEDEQTNNYRPLYKAKTRKVVPQVRTQLQSYFKKKCCLILRKG